MKKRKIEKLQFERGW